jgi:threonine 3-dehydrogenase
LVLIGLPQKTLQVEQPTKEIVFKSITMSTIHGRRIFSTWEKCEKMIAEKKVR